MTEALPVLSIVIAVSLALLQYFVFISTLMQRVTSIETKVGLFWGLVERELPSILKRPTHLTMDVLLDKMSLSGLTIDEAKDLWDRLYCLNDLPTERVVIRVLLLSRLEQIIRGMG